MEKTCFKCKFVGDPSLFKNKRNICKTCWRIYRRNYNKTPLGKAKKVIENQKRKIKDYEKYKKSLYDSGSINSKL